MALAVNEHSECPQFVADLPCTVGDRHRRRLRSQSPGLGASVSQCGSAISRWTVMN